MSNIKFCSIIIKDDFNNILISKRKGKKADEHLWYVFERKIKGGAIFVHCLGRGATGGCVSMPREKMIEILKWIDPKKNPKILVIPKDDLDDYTFANGELEKINAFFDTI